MELGSPRLTLVLLRLRHLMGKVLRWPDEDVEAPGKRRAELGAESAAVGRKKSVQLELPEKKWP